MSILSFQTFWKVFLCFSGIHFFLNQLPQFLLIFHNFSKPSSKIVCLISSTILSCSARKYKVYGYNKLQTSMPPKYYPKILCFIVGFRLFQMVLCDTNLNKLPKDWPDRIKLYSKDYKIASRLRMFTRLRGYVRLPTNFRSFLPRGNPMSSNSWS